MNCLAVDTGSNHLTVLLTKGDKVYKSHIDNAMLKHSVTLMPEIEALLESSNTALCEIDVFCAVVGPGSFTGIRIGVSTIKALAYSQNKKVLSVTSFEVLAYNSDRAKVLSVIDARHDNFYACGFVNKKVVLEPCFINLESLVELSKEYFVVTDTDILVDIAYEKANVLDGFINAVTSNLDRASIDRESLVPLYVKKSQAEEEL